LERRLLQALMLVQSILVRVILAVKVMVSEARCLAERCASSTKWKTRIWSDVITSHHPWSLMQVV